MAKKRGRKPVKQNVINIDSADEEATVAEKHENQFQDHEVERQSAAIRALRDVEIEQLRTMLQLLRSYFGKEQLQVPLLQCFKENLPNLDIVKNEKDGHYEVKQKNNEGNLCTNQGGGGNLHASLLHRLSMVYPDFSTAEPSHGGFDFSNKSVKTSFFGIDNLQIRGFDLEELSDAPVFEQQDKFQTPDVNNQRLSIGVTPKTKRLPKHGEMLLSVHGSPLGVYKEDSMEAIDGELAETFYYILYRRGWQISQIIPAKPSFQTFSLQSSFDPCLVLMFLLMLQSWKMVDKLCFYHVIDELEDG